MSDWLLTRLHQEPGGWLGPVPVGLDGGMGDDTQLALHLCYELHYRGLEGVDDGWEWDPSLLAARAELEARFLAALPARRPTGNVVVELQALVEDGSGPSLSTHMAEEGTLDELREFAVHRSAYQLKEADPHTWALPRLTGRAKAAMVRIQADEYGDGSAVRMHSALFAHTMEALDLDATYGRYVDLLPGVALATGNLVTMLGLHRRFRGACVGHLATFEMTSVGPMSRYAAACHRLGLPAEARRFYDVHVAADSIHGVVALHDMVGSLVEDDPVLAADVLWGARCLMHVERRLTEHLLDAWAANRTSLLRPLDALAPAA